VSADNDPRIRQAAIANGTRAWITVEEGRKLFDFMCEVWLNGDEFDSDTTTLTVDEIITMCRAAMRGL
jgi:hypothetical protein